MTKRLKVSRQLRQLFKFHIYICRNAALRPGHSCIAPPGRKAHCKYCIEEDGIPHKSLCDHPEHPLNMKLEDYVVEDL